ncbi:MAG: hypothetical protein KDC85_08105 [Saprospiraceae bacterium]|nr:hypothetical protein [Saprospiraceae bacterium]MCB9324531.1 GHMP kinase [Lewinellaceae bacterium]
MPGALPFKIHTNGKLLLSGEYFVLDGALALAVPTKKGQLLEVSPVEESQTLHWQSMDHQGALWFEAVLLLPDLQIVRSTDQEIAERLGRILQEALMLKGTADHLGNGLEVKTFLDFPREWGLGSSSTLIAAVASWMEVDAYALLWNSFGGSGYDIACALSEGPLLYQLKERHPVVTSCAFDPDFKDQLCFVYLGKKQSSRKGIQKYRLAGKARAGVIDEVSHLTEAFLKAKTLFEFEDYIRRHENLISRELDLPTAGDLHFKTFPGAVKSLGAWGGDFVLATSPMDLKETQQWFNTKGFATVINYEAMVK